MRAKVGYLCGCAKLFVVKMLSVGIFCYFCVHQALQYISYEENHRRRI